MGRSHTKPFVVITGSAGNIGSRLREVLSDNYTVIGMDRNETECEIPFDLSSEDSVRLAFNQFRERYGNRIAAVIHLAAYFDFSGEDSPLYDEVNVKGTTRLLDVLQDLEVERFIYSGTMLVHKPVSPGQVISENDPVEPKWAYPESKQKAERAIKQHHGKIPYVILRLAGLYNEKTAVPTLSHQISRIYERVAKSHLYAGDMECGQSLIHEDDMMDLFRRTVDRRNELPEEISILAGEPDTLSYKELQDTIGRLIHGEEKWKTFLVPESLAKAAAWIEEKSEPVVPDAIDHGEKPFIRPFMIDMASDHYALDIDRAQHLLDWTPEHDIRDVLPAMIQSLKEDPLHWYSVNGITPPDWLRSTDEKTDEPEKLRTRYEAKYRDQHRQNLWAHFLTIGLGFWLISSPFTLGYESVALTASDVIAGALVVFTGLLSLSWRLGMARWATAAVGLWVLFAPLLFWSPTAASYLNGTLVGALLMGFAVLTRPVPGVSPAAEVTGPTVPPGWEFSPSSWFQRLPIIILAFVGLYISRYMAAYQLGHIDAVWDPFFAGALPDAKNGTEEIITSHVSEAWPVPDAGLGAAVYMLEILTGIIGSSRRWRTMPWLVLLFGFMIVPLGAVSITFIIIQPIILDTWCTLCLIAAAAMLIQIPYSFDELVATGDFLWRRWKQGRPVLRILFTGDTDEENDREDKDDFERSPANIVKKMLAGGLSAPWNLQLVVLIGIWLMFTRLTLGTEGAMANADHLIGALVVTFTVTAFAEVMRPIRFVNIFMGMALTITP
ncbi:MAG: vitamin K epoxide reductase family protein, partial [Gammaproteobacteria bacterium]